jgi:hypothetical protein
MTFSSIQFATAKLVGIALLPMALCIRTGYTFAALDSQTVPVLGPQEHAQAAHKLLANMKASRDLLKSGSYRASGAVLRNSNVRGVEPLLGRVEIFSAFDFEKGLLRFDQTQPVRRQIAGEEIPDQDKVEYIRTQELAITWIKPWRHKNLAINTAVGIHPPTLKPPLGISPFDVRSLGLTLWDDFKASTAFSASYETWDRSRRIEVFPEANGVNRLRLVQGHRSGTYVPQDLWIDELQGFSPVRLSYSIPPAERGQPEEYINACRMRWKQEAGVWVPAFIRIERRIRGRLIEF